MINPKEAFQQTPECNAAGEALDSKMIKSAMQAAFAKYAMDQAHGVVSAHEAAAMHWRLEGAVAVLAELSRIHLKPENTPRETSGLKY